MAPPQVKFSGIMNRTPQSVSEDIHSDHHCGHLVNLGIATSLEQHGLMHLSGNSSAPGFDTKTTKCNQPLGIHPTHPRYLRQMFYQNFFSIQDGTLIWKKFPSDQLFFRTTGLFLTLGFAYAVYKMFRISLPKKKED